MPRKIPELSKLQIGRLRANLSRKNTQIGVRLQRNAMGTLTDENGDKAEMTAGQLKAAEILFKNTLPGQQSTEFNDVSEPEKTREQIESEYQQALESLPVSDLTEVLRNMPAEERQALIDSMRETTQ
jgi:Mg/Co/Ni transporter MgtE